MIKLRTITLFIFCILIFSSCEMRNFPPNSGSENNNDSTTTDTTAQIKERKMLILCEGLFQLNNSTLSRYNMETGKLEKQVFKAANSRGLGDTGNEMKRYGSKTYILVNVSSQIEIIDHHTGKSIKQIPLFNDKNVARQPRSIEFHEDKAYVTCFDGYVLRLDTATLEIDAMLKCGKNPEGICKSLNKLYVANSGGLDYPDYDSTVSVIDIPTFKEIKKITVEENPVSIAADSEGDVYVITQGNYADKGYQMHRINAYNDELEHSFTDFKPLSLYIYKDIAYMYSYNYSTKQQNVYTFNCLSEEIEKTNFVSDGTQIKTPYNITVDEETEDVYILDAYNFTIMGDVLCFSKDGKLKYRIEEVGLNPNSIVLY